MSTPGAQAIDPDQRGYWKLALFGGFFVLIAMPFLFVMPGEVRAGEYGILFVLLFPLTGVVMLLSAWRTHRCLRRFGAMPVYPDPPQGQLQGDIGGHVVLDRAVPPDAAFELALLCIHSTVTGSGKNRRRSERTLWQEAQTPWLDRSSSPPVLRFCFQPPEGLPATEPRSNDYRFWRLLLDAESDGTRIDRTYEMPVVAGNQRCSKPLPQPHIEKSAIRAQVAALESVSRQIEVQSLPDGVRLFSPAARHPKLRLGFSAFGAIFAGAAVFMVVVNGGWMAWFMATVFGLIGFPLLAIPLYRLGCSLSAEIGNGTVRTRRFFLGYPLRSERIRFDSVRQLELHSGMSTTSRKGRKTEYFNLRVNAEGRKLVIAESIRGRPEAEALRDGLIRLLRVSA